MIPGSEAARLFSELRRRRNDTVTVHWYEHDCDWVTKYCDEHHLHAAAVPREVLRQYEQ